MSKIEVIEFLCLCCTSFSVGNYIRFIKFNYLSFEIVVKKVSATHTHKKYNKIILFDGVCNLCSAYLNFVYDKDIEKLYRFAWIQSDQGKEILTWLNLPTEDYETIVYIENGRPYYKSTAFLKIVKSLRFPWPILWLWVVIPKFIRNWFYDLTASNRYRIFGKKDKCVVPTGHLKERFL